MRMRAATVYDIPGIYRVCDKTGPATRNPDLLGHIYAGPYLQNQGDLASVIADEKGVAGYVFGCRDSAVFEQWCESSWWPALRAQYPIDPNDPDADIVQSLHQPPRSPRSLLGMFPAHVHIDLLPRAQGRGFGRALMGALCAELLRQGVSGVHLGVGVENTNAIEFYHHLGYQAAFENDSILWMTRTLAG